MARKAVEGGTSPMARIMERFGVGPNSLADRLGVDVALVEQLLAEPRRAPLVMIDAEDALALTDEAAELGRVGAANVLSTADWSGGGPRSLRFYRPPGLNLETTASELYGLLWALAERSTDGSIPLDGIVFPKVEHPEEVDLVHGMLTEAEHCAGPAGGRYPGGLPHRVRLGCGAAGGDRRTSRRPAVRARVRARRLLRGPGSAVHHQ